MEIFEDKDLLMTDRRDEVITDNESAEIANESAQPMKPQIWNKSDMPSSHASSIDQRQIETYQH